jgi:RHS repeat-associated protein
MLSPNITQFLQTQDTSITGTTKPQAYVNWVLFDQQMNYVAESSGFDPVGDPNEWKQHILINLPITKSGYLYIYVSNVTLDIEVYFDNLQVTHVRGPLLEETHYYPFGLLQAGISDKALKSNYTENKLRFGGKELQHQEFSDDSGLEEYDFGKRMQDPQLGRWWGIDPLTELDRRWSPYNYAKNNPIRFLDPDGMWAEDANGYFTSDPNEIKAFLNSVNFDKGQRKKATDKAKEYVNKKPEGNSYENGKKGQPGEKVDCSGMVSSCVVAGGEPNPSNSKDGFAGTGVQIIEHNTTKVNNDKDVEPGNIVTFHFDTGWPTHTGLLIDVVKDKDGKITSFTMIDSHSGEGPEERSVTVGVGYLGEHIAGYYKWDSKTDAPSSTSNNSEYNRLTQIAKYAEQKGLKNAAAYYRAEAEKVKSK